MSLPTPAPPPLWKTNEIEFFLCLLPCYLCIYTLFRGWLRCDWGRRGKHNWWQTMCLKRGREKEMSADPASHTQTHIHTHKCRILTSDTHCSRVARALSLCLPHPPTKAGPPRSKLLDIHVGWNAQKGVHNRQQREGGERVWAEAMGLPTVLLTAS